MVIRKQTTTLTQAPPKGILKQPAGDNKPSTSGVNVAPTVLQIFGYDAMPSPMTKQPPQPSTKPSRKPDPNCNRFQVLAERNDETDADNQDAPTEEQAEKKSITWSEPLAQRDPDEPSAPLESLEGDPHVRADDDPPATTTEWTVVRPRRKWPAPQIVISTVNSNRILRPSIVHATSRGEFPRWFLEQRAMKIKREQKSMYTRPPTSPNHKVTASLVQPKCPWRVQ